MWLSHRLRDSSKVDSYLRAVEALFYGSPDHYDEEKVLELLHRCNYDPTSALELLQPWAKVEEEEEGQKTTEFDSDDMCSVCGDGGDLIICDAKGCKRVYHAVCAELAEIPSGTWECSVHFCSTCGSTRHDIRHRMHVHACDAPRRMAHEWLILVSFARSQRVNDANSVRCTSCPTAFCAAHIPACATHHTRRAMGHTIRMMDDSTHTSLVLLLSPWPDARSANQIKFTDFKSAAAATTRHTRDATRRHHRPTTALSHSRHSLPFVHPPPLPLSAGVRSAPAVATVRLPLVAASSLSSWRLSAAAHHRHRGRRRQHRHRRERRRSINRRRSTSRSCTERSPSEADSRR